MFDKIEARINRAAMKKLANAVATIGTSNVPVIFDAAYRAGMVGVVGMGASSPQMVIADSDVPADFIGSVVRINGADWEVSDRQPDGTAEAGLTHVFLEKA